MVLAAGQTHNKVYTFKDMLKEDDKADFVKAMTEEIEDREKRGHWVAVPRLSMPSGAKQYNQFGQSRESDNQDGTLNKH